MGEACGWQRNVCVLFAFSVGITVVLFAAVAWHGTVIADSHLVTALVALVPGGLIWMVPLIEAVTSNKIVLSDRGLTRSVSRGGAIQMEQWPWDEILGGRVGPPTFAGWDEDVLLIDIGAESPLPFELPARTVLLQVRDHFSERGRPFLLE
ncbi:MAG: hypothetical protein R3B90_18775 [Planctomycetaceae bacterium]